jgi:hypothetical protein
MKRTIVFALAAPAVVWLGLIVIGKLAPDAAGTAVATNRGFLIPVHRGLLVETLAAGALAAYLTAR